ncbi:MAG TPA: TetR/AcrR family transcriptional regulator [Parvularculaceae bacterium]|nr:TetR/AcrR family transcriptional regulator [Parvularculaceae bacterium]
MTALDELNLDEHEHAGRGRRPDPAKDQAIFDAARALFLEKGYRASIDEIAERAGVVKQTVYARYASKDDLFAATVRAVADELLDILAAAPAGKPRETLTAFAEQYRRIILEPKRIKTLGVMIAEAGQFPKLAARYYENGARYVHGRLADYLAKESAGGALNVADAKLAASQFFGLIKGVEHIGALLGDDEARRDLLSARRIADSLDAFLKIYGKR